MSPAPNVARDVEGLVDAFARAVRIRATRGVHQQQDYEAEQAARAALLHSLRSSPVEARGEAVAYGLRSRSGSFARDNGEIVAIEARDIAEQYARSWSERYSGEGPFTVAPLYTAPAASVVEDKSRGCVVAFCAEHADVEIVPGPFCPACSQFQVFKDGASAVMRGHEATKAKRAEAIVEECAKECDKLAAHYERCGSERRNAGRSDTYEAGEGHGAASCRDALRKNAAALASRGA